MFKCLNDVCFFFPFSISDAFSVATIDSELIPLDVYQSINESLELKCLLDAHNDKLTEVKTFKTGYFIINTFDLCAFIRF